MAQTDDLFDNESLYFFLTHQGNQIGDYEIKIR